MASTYTHTHRVEFAETDMAGIGHFSNFFRWMEQAEHAFLRSLGATVHGRGAGEDGGDNYGFARVHAECDYRRPVRFEDVLEVHLRVLTKGSKSLEYGFAFHLEGQAEQPALASGRIKVVCVSFDAAGELRAADLPQPIADLVEAAP